MACLYFLSAPYLGDVFRMALLMSYDLPVRLPLMEFRYGCNERTGKERRYHNMGREDFRGFYLSGAETGFFKRKEKYLSEKEAAPFAAAPRKLISLNPLAI